MGKPTTVYAVSEGEYSDYGVLAVFTSEEDAEHVAASMAGSYRRPFVETFTLYDEVPRRVTGWFMSGVIMDDDTIRDEKSNGKVGYPWEHWHGVPKRRPKVRWVRAPAYGGKGGRLEVSGGDQKAVRQAYSDNKARLLADTTLRYTDIEPE